MTRVVEEVHPILAGKCNICDPLENVPVVFYI